jgi:hypothetical protein
MPARAARKKASTSKRTATKHASSKAMDGAETIEATIQSDQMNWYVGTSWKFDILPLVLICLIILLTLVVATATASH